MKSLLREQRDVSYPPLHFFGSTQVIVTSDGISGVISFCN
jgi:hypothetical protein